MYCLYSPNTFLSGVDITKPKYFNYENDEISGVFYNEMWEGIVVEAQGGLRGTVTLSNNATIEHAATGIRSINGGRIYAEDARFYNNRIGVSIESHPNIPALTQFVGCEFKNDAPLRDAIYRYYLNDSSLKQERVSNLSGATQNHVQLLNSKGIVFHSCDFSNPYQEGAGEEHPVGFHPEHKATGISAKNSRLKAAVCTFKDLRHGIYFDNSHGLIEGCEFDYQFPNPDADGINMFSSDVIVTQDTRFYDLGWGIYAANAQSGPAGFLRVEQSMFYNNLQGIFLLGADYAQVKDCAFYVPPMPSAIETSAGVVISGSAAFDVTQNKFYRLNAGESFGIITDDTAEDYPNLIAQNDFGAGNVPSPSYSIHVENDNSRLQILCNDFNTYGQAQNFSDYYAIGLKDAALPNQGSLQEPTANQWDQQYFNHIDVEGTITPFNYYRYLNTEHAPTTNSNDINVFNNQAEYNENTLNTCGANPCEGESWPCEQQKIGELEQEISQAGSWGLPPVETEQRIREIEYLQEQLAIDMIRRLVLVDSGALAAERLEVLLTALPHLNTDKAVLEQRYGVGGSMGLVQSSNLSSEQFICQKDVIDPSVPHQDMRDIVQQAHKSRKNIRLGYTPVKNSGISVVKNGASSRSKTGSTYYPNPAKSCNYMNLNLKVSEKSYRVEWRDLFGRTILTNELMPISDVSYRCPTPCGMVSGYYILLVFDNESLVESIPAVLLD